MSCYQYIDSQLCSFVAQSLLISPWNDLMAMDQSDFQSRYFYHFLLGQIFNSLIFEITLNCMKIIRKRFSPVMHLSTTHIACTNDRVNFVRCNHLSIFCRHLGGSVRDMKISKQEDKDAHLLFVSHLFQLIIIDFVSKQILKYTIRCIYQVSTCYFIFIVRIQSTIINYCPRITFRLADNKLNLQLYFINKTIQMKPSDKPESKKKQKPVLSKVTSAPNLMKKVQPKKTAIVKKQEIPAAKRQQIKSPPTHSINNSNPKSTTSATSAQSINSVATRSTKVIINSLRTSPKSSIAQINSVVVKKVSMQTKAKAPMLIKKTPSKVQDQALTKVKQQVKKSLANVIKVYHPEKQQSYLDISMTEESADLKNKQQKLARNDFNFLSVIGEGGYGKVWKVEHHKTGLTFAMKEMSKAIIIMKKSAENVLNQLKILSKLKNPFIANIAFAYNDRDNLYLGMDYLSGGDLRSFLAQSEKLKQQEAKFLIACIIKALQYIHANKIFHRDVKPENLVLDQKGYLRLTDFGIARSSKDKQCLDASGTPGYMAPEVLCKQVHSFSVDFYAVGIVCYELMIGKRPYSGQNRNQIRDAILSKQHCLKKKDIPPKWSMQSADFINKLILRQANTRLGSKSGIQQLKQHPWFAKYPWKQLEQKKVISPFKPKYNGPIGTDRMEEYEQAVNQYKLLQRTDEKVDIFGGYYFNLR